MHGHNEVLNGSTKRTILTATIFVGIITFTALILAAVLFNNGANWREILGIKGTFGSVSFSGMVILKHLIVKFMDVRTSVEKDKYKLECKQIALEKYKYKIDSKRK